MGQDGTGDWTGDHVLALASDPAAAAAARALASGGALSRVGATDTVAWALASGSGSVPYQVVVDVADPPDRAGYSCSCPSRKRPCKHALAVMLRYAAGQLPVGDQPADFAAAWESNRVARVLTEAERAEKLTGARVPSEKTAAQREARITAGLVELDRWLLDQVRTGIAGTAAKGPGHFERIAARMVDAQAPGVAGRLRSLSGVVASGDGWPGRLLQEYALLRLLVLAHRRIEELDDPTAATVRSHLGIPVASAAVLAFPGLRDRWTVLGARDTVDGRILSRRFWLSGSESGRWALVLQFRPNQGAPWTGTAPPVTVGHSFSGELHFYPGAGQVRAAIGDGPEPEADAARRPGCSIAAAAAQFATVLADDPWAGSAPVMVRAAVTRHDRSWFLVDDGGEAVPLLLQGADPWRLFAAAAGRPADVLVEWTPRGVVPLTVWSADGGVTL